MSAANQSWEFQNVAPINEALIESWYAINIRAHPCSSDRTAGVCVAAHWTVSKAFCSLEMTTTH